MEDGIRNFVAGIAAMKKAGDLGLTEEDVRSPDQRKYLFAFHEGVIDEARKALEEPSNKPRHS